jgi:hypothetical protein
LDSRELLDLLYGLFELPVIGFDVVEVAPKLDDAHIAVFAARKILTECGHHWRKKKQIRGSYETGPSRKQAKLPVTSDRELCRLSMSRKPGRLRDDSLSGDG